MSQPGDWRAVTGNRPELSHRCQDRASQEVLCVLCEGRCTDCGYAGYHGSKCGPDGSGEYPHPEGNA